MTPKEKALELIGKFYYTGIDEYSCKQCALIAINELEKQEATLLNYTSERYSSEYWQEVKKEIELL